ncbi:hypothetical protein Ahy_B03g065808 [Arachis hypogaea]|uniref:Replication protein A 70 kDa DNA-binding subunit B/D first OB fold domain-containing protein n=1 Tax=Arachis hypogaea TaxID=3818 RepID=A0A445A2G5_ARAHY|nr:hypothetical protein Ahy_B03g065808 [Arachis hypogaea]
MLNLMYTSEIWPEQLILLLKSMIPIFLGHWLWGWLDCKTFSGVQLGDGDRIHATISKPVLEGFRHQIKKHGIYSMRNFIIKTNNDKVRTSPHKYKLSFYTKTEIIFQLIEMLAFNPFKFCPFTELESKGTTDENLLFGKEEARDLITHTGQESKHNTL